MDEDDRQRNLAQVRAIRAKLGHVVHPVSSIPDAPAVGPTRAPLPESEGGVLDDPGRMAEQMAAGAERERLEERVRRLEAEVDQLRSALGEVLRTVAGALQRDRHS